MNLLSFYNLILLTIIRIIGLALSIEFLINLKKKRFIAPVFGWICWVVTGFLPIIADNLTTGFLNEILLLMNAILSAEGLILIFMGILSYFRFVPGKIMFLVTLFYMIFPLTIYGLFGETFALPFAVAMIFISYVAISLMILLKGKEINTTIRGGAKWLYLTIISVICYLILSIILMLSIEDYSYGLYYSTNILAIISNYTMGILLTILIIVLFIHLERGIAYMDKDQLKDKYSHNIGNILQIIISAASIIEMRGTLDESEKPNILLIQEKCNEAGELIKEIREL
ncbi:MAG: hypothetical protein ACFFB5_08530 [Promethearchaeota archaeon]